MAKIIQNPGILERLDREMSEAKPLGPGRQTSSQPDNISPIRRELLQSILDLSPKQVRTVTLDSPKSCRQFVTTLQQVLGGRAQNYRYESLDDTVMVVRKRTTKKV